MLLIRKGMGVMMVKAGDCQEVDWKEICGSCSHALFSPSGKEETICKMGRFREVDLHRKLCPHRAEGQVSFKTRIDWY